MSLFYSNNKIIFLIAFLCFNFIFINVVNSQNCYTATWNYGRTTTFLAPVTRRRDGSLWGPTTLNSNTLYSSTGIYIYFIFII